MPGAAAAAFVGAETAAAAAMTAAFKEALSVQDRTQADATAIKLALAVSTYVKACVGPGLAVTFP